MGDPKKSRKKWERPGHPWIKERLLEEMELVGKYGLRNKRELWRAQTFLRRIRDRAKALLSLAPEVRAEREAELVRRLFRMGLLESDKATVDEILGLTVEDILQRRLQTIVFRKGLARTIHEARQMIVHGHIAIAGRRVTSPGYLVWRDVEDLIDISPGSPMAERVKEWMSEKQASEQEVQEAQA
ncbi:MAG: 30S ribosomal protein S4 [Desulfurococcales archaeon]|nr:30S ribosomal protein S4 [Desulfurococcales archaeon]